MPPQWKSNVSDGADSGLVNVNHLARAAARATQQRLRAQGAKHAVVVSAARAAALAVLSAAETRAGRSTLRALGSVPTVTGPDTRRVGVAGAHRVSAGVLGAELPHRLMLSREAAAAAASAATRGAVLVAALALRPDGLGGGDAADQMKLLGQGSSESTNSTGIRASGSSSGIGSDAVKSDAGAVAEFEPTLPETETETDTEPASEYSSVVAAETHEYVSSFASVKPSARSRTTSLRSNDGTAITVVRRPPVPLNSSGGVSIYKPSPANYYYKSYDDGSVAWEQWTEVDRLLPWALRERAAMRAHPTLRALVDCSTSGPGSARRGKLGGAVAGPNTWASSPSSVSSQSPSVKPFHWALLAPVSLMGVGARRKVLLELHAKETSSLIPPPGSDATASKRNRGKSSRRGNGNMAPAADSAASDSAAPVSRAPAPASMAEAVRASLAAAASQPSQVDGSRLLHAAARWNDPVLLRFLLDFVYANTSDADGAVPDTDDESAGNIFGGNFGMRTNESAEPLSPAAAARLVASPLLQTGHTAAATGEAATRMRRSAPALHAPDLDGQTPLIIALRSRNAVAAAILLAAGAPAAGTDALWSDTSRSWAHNVALWTEPALSNTHSNTHNSSGNSSGSSSGSGGGSGASVRSAAAVVAAEARSRAQAAPGNMDLAVSAAVAEAEAQAEAEAAAKEAAAANFSDGSALYRAQSAEAVCGVSAAILGLDTQAQAQMQQQQQRLRDSAPESGSGGSNEESRRWLARAAASTKLVVGDDLVDPDNDTPAGSRAAVSLWSELDHRLLLRDLASLRALTTVVNTSFAFDDASNTGAATAASPLELSSLAALAAPPSRATLIRALSLAGSSVSAPDSRGRAPLQDTVMRGDDAATAVLLALGADPAVAVTTDSVAVAAAIQNKLNWAVIVHHAPAVGAEPFSAAAVAAAVAKAADAVSRPASVPAADCSVHTVPAPVTATVDSAVGPLTVTKIALRPLVGAAVLVKELPVWASIGLSNVALPAAKPTKAKSPSKGSAKGAKSSAGSVSDSDGDASQLIRADIVDAVIVDSNGVEIVVEDAHVHVHTESVATATGDAAVGAAARGASAVRKAMPLSAKALEERGFTVLFE